MSKADRLLSVHDARRLTGLGRSTIYALIANSTFPRPAKIGRKTVFSEREIRGWIHEHLSRRPKATPIAK